MEQHRTMTWRRLLLLNKQEFLVWMNENQMRLRMYNKLAEDLEQYIKMCLTIGPFYEGNLSTVDLCKQFANCILGVYANCDDPQML